MTCKDFLQALTNNGDKHLSYDIVKHGDTYYGYRDMTMIGDLSVEKHILADDIMVMKLENDVQRIFKSIG